MILESASVLHYTYIVCLVACNMTRLVEAIRLQIHRFFLYLQYVGLQFASFLREYIWVS